MFKWAVEEEECENNPTIGVQKHNYQSDSHRAYYSLGTKQRVALDLVWPAGTGPYRVRR